MGHTARTRIIAALVSAVAWSALITFLIANAIALGSIWRAVWLSFGFLTDWSNWFVSIVTLAIALGWQRLSGPVTTAVATAAILLVGVMFAALRGWVKLFQHFADTLFRLSDLLAHVATPIAMLLAWLLVFPHGRLRWSDAPRFMLFPLAYLVEMFGRGLSGGGYPYPEVDVPTVGWSAALLFSGGVTLLFFGLGAMLVAVDRWLGPDAAAAAVAARRGEAAP